MEFCNLSEPVARYYDTLEDLKRKVRIGAIFGCLQATLTDFKNLRPQWKQKCEEERLLGVSITGIMDCPLLHDEKYAYETTGMSLAGIYATLKQEVIDTAEEWSKRLNIPMPMATTCIK